MIKKVTAAAAFAASVAGIGAGMAPQAMAIGNDNGINTVNGNNAAQIYGNQATYGNMSPQMALIQGSFNKPCIALPAKANLQSLVGLVTVGVLQDVPILSNPMNQQCTENSTQAKGDEPLSHILDNIPILSGNVSHGS
ncbi:rodlin [Streptomyces sp. NPDC046866]|uniref:rodlin n=1 Tax=Streptomyces sp. NPDC046866 TaxID=3154921 RepID=UPI0034512922